MSESLSATDTPGMHQSSSSVRPEEEYQRIERRARNAEARMDYGSATALYDEAAAMAGEAADEAFQRKPGVVSVWYAHQTARNRLLERRDEAAMGLGRARDVRAATPRSWR